VDIRRVLATWNDIEDLVSIGAYVPGANADYDIAVQTRDRINTFLRQDRSVGSTFEESVAAVRELGQLIGQVTRRLKGRSGPPAADAAGRPGS